MKKLCLGTLLRILCDAKLPTTKQYLFLSDLLSTVKSDDRYDDSKFQSALLSGKNNLVDYEDILIFDKKTLVNIFESKIKPNFDENGQRLVIICVRDVLKEDTTINDSVTIGFEKEGYTKQDLLNKQIFPFSAFLANVYYYCTTQVENIPYKANIKEVKNYTKSQIHRIDEVQLETEATYVASTIKLTLDPEPFNRVFKEIKDIKLSIPNHNELKIYRLDVVNNEFDYTKLQDFITDNIGRYIYSRGQLNKYKLDPRSTKLAIESLRAYNKRVKSNPSTTHFNEIMLYSFLECILGAPKIFSKMELQNSSGTFESLSSGIHILTLKQGGRLFNQLIFGATESLYGLEYAVDEVLKQVLAIKSTSAEEYKFLESTILTNSFDAETNEALKNMILPQKGAGLSKPDNAFGLFLGYTVECSNNVGNPLYLINLEKQMIADINNISIYIEGKIRKLGLTNYSFYIYIVPLNDAFLDGENIMADALKVGEKWNLVMQL